MKTTVEIENSLLDYFANSTTSIDFVDKLSKFGEISEEKEEKICNLLAESQRDWDNIECDIEGATKEQHEEMEAYIDSVISEILTICEIKVIN